MLIQEQHLLLAGAFGAYSLGANNIANVMGVFVPISPFHRCKQFLIYLCFSVLKNNYFYWVV